MPFDEREKGLVYLVFNCVCLLFRYIRTYIDVMWRVHRKRGWGGDETTMWPSVGHALSMVESCEGCAKQHARGRQCSAAQGWRVEEKKTINTFLSSSVFSLSPFYKLEGFFLSLSEWTTDLPSFLCVSLCICLRPFFLHFFFARIHPS